MEVLKPEYLPFVQNNRFITLFSHPFCILPLSGPDSVFEQNEKNKLINSMIESRRINTDKLISEGNQIVALKFVERPFRLTMAIKLAHQMPALESWKMFSWLFDHADANTFAATDQWEAIFRRPGNPSLRTEAFQALPKVVNVYRMPTFPSCVYSLNPDDGVLVGTAEKTDIAHHGKTRVWLTHVWISKCHIHQQ